MVQYGRNHRNNSTCTVNIRNGLSFDNERDYQLETCTIKQFENAYASNYGVNKLPSGFEVTPLSDEVLSDAKTYLNDKIAELEKYVKKR